MDDAGVRRAATALGKNYAAYCRYRAAGKRHRACQHDSPGSDTQFVAQRQSCRAAALHRPWHDGIEIRKKPQNEDLRMDCGPDCFFLYRTGRRNEKSAMVFLCIMISDALSPAISLM